jgi:hypothetical protein
LPDAIDVRTQAQETELDTVVGLVDLALQKVDIGFDAYLIQLGHLRIRQGCACVQVAPQRCQRLNLVLRLTEGRTLPALDSFPGAMTVFRIE